MASRAMNVGDGSIEPWMWRTAGGATCVVGDVAGDERRFVELLGDMRESVTAGTTKRWWWQCGMSYF
jgi:hypothetical protein